MKEKLLISFSGGRTSAYMTRILLDRYKDVYEMVVVFANTGKEREETLEFVQKCDDEWGFNVVWVEAVVNNGRRGTSHRIVNFDIASRNGEPFIDVINKYGLPNVSFIHCTRELKTAPIHHYIKSIGWRGYSTAIGIRVDEIDRVSPTAKKQKFIYPLVSYQHGVTKSDINLFWSKQSFDLNLKSYEGNCDLCYKKTLRKLLTICKDNPQLYEWWIMVEEKYENFAPESRKHITEDTFPLRIFRHNKSIKEIIELSKTSLFEPSKDESRAVDKYKNMILDLWGDLDASNGCIESCEPF